MKHSKFIIFFTIVVFFTNCRLGKNQKTASFKKIKISYTEEYCGGAAPPDAILNELSVLKSLKNKEIEIFLSKNVESKPLVLITDSIGTVLIPENIAPTIYVNLYTPISFYKDAETNDKQYFNCYKSFLNENLISVNLSENQNEFTLISLLKCNPCVPPAP
ncbi:MAG: hypothetical protein HUU47_00270 [Bacteroidetes bacterium]|nr:hypothetical protein [Bacteroidota bacterium]